MASGRKPAWLDEETHRLIKKYAKLKKTSMTEATSELVLQYVEKLEGGTDAEGAVAAAQAPVTAAATPAAAPAAAEAPKAEERAPVAAKVEKTEPAPKRPRRKSEDGVKYLGGIWLV